MNKEDYLYYTGRTELVIFGCALLLIGIVFFVFYEAKRYV